MAKPSQFSFLDQGQEFVVFSNGCLDLSVMFGLKKTLLSLFMHFFANVS